MGLVHEHNILGFQWTQGAVHVHQYSMETTINDGHSHLAQGTTTAANNTIDHFHCYEGKTCFVGHVHQFFGTTGSPVYMADRTHFHEFSGTTIFDDGHVHYYSGLTGREFP